MTELYYGQTEVERDTESTKPDARSTTYLYGRQLVAVPVATLARLNRFNTVFRQDTHVGAHPLVDAGVFFPMPTHWVSTG